jgi:hypothetical protein
VTTTFGLDVHLAARIAAAGHGGQVLISEATRTLVEHALPDGVSLRDLGRHRLKDIVHPEHLNGGTKFTRRVQITVSGMMKVMQPLMGMMLPKQNKGFLANLKRVLEQT